MGTAVLVHGAWSSPADWQWVADCLHAQDIQAVMPDLPSHRAGQRAGPMMSAKSRPPSVPRRRRLPWRAGRPVSRGLACGAGDDLDRPPRRLHPR